MIGDLCVHAPSLRYATQLTTRDHQRLALASEGMSARDIKHVRRRGATNRQRSQTSLGVVAITMLAAHGGRQGATNAVVRCSQVCEATERACAASIAAALAPKSAASQSRHSEASRLTVPAGETVRVPTARDYEAKLNEARASASHG